jgi:hypothetical protein
VRLMPRIRDGRNELDGRARNRFRRPHRRALPDRSEGRGNREPGSRCDDRRCLRRRYVGMAEPRSPAVFVSACERSLIRSVNAGTRRASPQNPPPSLARLALHRLRVAANRCLWFANPLPSSIESLSLAIRHANHRNARLPQLQICGNREVHFPFDHGQFAAEISVGKLGATVGIETTDEDVRL